MRIFAGYFLAVLIACAGNQCLAQTATSAIQGKVFTDSKGPVEGAAVVLLNNRDSSVVKSLTSTKSGTFYFGKLEAGSYLVYITKQGFLKSYTGPFEIASGKSRDIGFVILRPAQTQLKGVTIVGRRDVVENHANKTVLNLDQNITAAGASLYDVLSSSPGVKVQNDEVLYRGGQKALIAVNGKPVLLSGDELVNFLKNYQASSISQIELIENPGAKYDAVASGGMINIILKKTREVGSKVTVTESAGYGDKYKFNSGLIYNLHTDNLNLFASYGFQDNKSPHTIYNNRDILSGGQLYDFNLNYNAQIKSLNNNFTLGADYEFAKGQTLSFLVNGFDNTLTYDKLNTTVISTNGIRDSSINTQSTINRDITNISYNLGYKSNLNKSGNSVLSFDGNYTNYHRTSDELLQNTFVNPAGQTDGTIFYRDNSPSHIVVQSANIDFSQALSKSSHLDAGVKASKVSSDNQIDFSQQTMSGFVPVPELTNHFVYDEQTNAAYLSFNSKIKKTSFTVSLRAEQTKTSALSSNPNRKVDSSYFDLFPNLQVMHELDKNNTLTLNYSRNINRPNYQDLNPFVGYVDQFYYSTGNPYLRPSYVNTYEVSDFVMNKYKVSFSVVVTDDYFNTVFQQDDVTKVYTTIKENLGTRTQFLLEFSAPLDLTSWWHIDPDLILTHDRYHYNQVGVAPRTNNEVIFSLNQNFKITPKLSAQLVNLYDSPTYFAISQYTAQYVTNAAVSYSVLKNKGSIKLGVSDVFNGFYNQYHSNYANLNITEKDKNGSRFVTATFVYHFGTSSARNRANTTDEQKRLGGSSNEN